jgi:hypothetical protein
MGDAARVRGGEAAADLDAILDRLARRDRPVGKAIAQGLPFEQLQHHVSETVFGADIVDGEYVRIVEGPDGSSFELEAPKVFRIVFASGGDDLEGDVPSEARVAGPVDLAHPPRANRRADLIRAEVAARSERH